MCGTYSEHIRLLKSPGTTLRITFVFNSMLNLSEDRIDCNLTQHTVRGSASQIHHSKYCTTHA